LLTEIEPAGLVSTRMGAAAVVELVPLLLVAVRAWLIGAAATPTARVVAAGAEGVTTFVAGDMLVALTLLGAGVVSVAVELLAPLVVPAGLAPVPVATTGLGVVPATGVAETPDAVPAAFVTEVAFVLLVGFVVATGLVFVATTGPGVVPATGVAETADAVPGAFVTGVAFVLLVGFVVAAGLVFVTTTGIAFVIGAAVWFIVVLLNPAVTFVKPPADAVGANELAGVDGAPAEVAGTAIASASSTRTAAPLTPIPLTACCAEPFEEVAAPYAFAAAPGAAF